MPFEFDPAKDAANIAKHGLSLGEFDGFDAEGRCLIYTERDGTFRLIGFRSAREKEMRRYE